MTIASAAPCALSTLCPSKGSLRKGCTTPKARDLSPSDKLVYLAQALQEIAHHKCLQNEADTFAVLRQTLTLHSNSLHTLRIDMARKEELTSERILLLEATVDELRPDVQTAQEERKRVVQEIKHTENGRLKANERARSAEEKLKKAAEQGELDRKEALQERQRAQQLQKRVNDLLRKAQSAVRQCDHQDDAKSKKVKDTMPDVAGLQRGLDKVKGQLKKKQDEFQAQAQTLQQTTAKVKNLEQKLTEDQKKIQRLEEQVDSLASQMEEEHLQIRSERLTRDMERQKGADLLSSVKERYQAATVEIARLNRLLDYEMEKSLRREAQASEEENSLRQLLQLKEERSLKLVEQISRLEEQLNTVSYEPLGDANIADRIRIRNLVDQVQERLATKAGLKPSGPGELLSLTWRVALGPSVDDASRVQRAKELLAGKDLDQYDRAFLADEQALRHVCQHYSRFRKPGNDLHQLLTRDGYLASIRRYLKFNPSEDRGDALWAMARYVFPPSA